MRAVSYSNGKVSTSLVENPSGEGVLVNISSAGICGSDLHLLSAGVHSPHVAGHEISGITSDGTSVAIEPIITCNTCGSCESGDYHLCKNDFQGIGMSVNGGMSEQIMVPEKCLIKLDPKIILKDACLIEPLAVAYHGFVRTNTESKHKIAVIGGGTIGLCAVAVAKFIGSKVDLYARYDHQKIAGEKLGADEIDGLYDRVIDCVGTKESLAMSTKLAKPGSWIVLLGIPMDGIHLPGMKTIMNEIKLFPSIMYGSTSGVKDFECAAKILSSNPEIGEHLITHRFSLEDSEEAFRVAQDKNSQSIKVVFDPTL
jgi:threonine dehydrogenase-like Zn-dependent dehydrogenase|tara:strand:- start:3349 stop:4287 length:939 start_codon:yes stop_codon:yes gene_type:complete